MVALLAVIVFGGLKRIAGAAEQLIPLLSVGYLLGGMVVLWQYRQEVPGCLAEIFRQAFSWKGVTGGAGGSLMAAGIRYGVGRGVFSNEAGLGSSGMVYAAAENARPVEAGMWGIFELFLDTMVVCTVTALVVLTTGTAGSAPGAGMVAEGFAKVFGSAGEVFVTVSVVLFAFAAMLGWEFYGERGMITLTGEETKGYRWLFLAAAYVGGTARLEMVWDLSEIFNGLMALPNLYALFRLSGEVVEETRAYFLQKKETRR